MTEEQRLQLDRLLDGDLLGDEEAQVLQWVESDPEVVAYLAERAWLVSALHKSIRRRQLQAAALQEMGLANEETDSVEEFSADFKPQPARLARWNPLRLTFASLTAAVVLLLTVILVWHGGSTTPASAATLALHRMIEVASQSIDRVYRIRIVDHGPDGKAAPVFESIDGSKPGIDGAMLYVRGSDKFVLSRQFGNGTKLVTGSDGEIGWAVPPHGHIHLSHDTRRFRRAVPGEHEEVPFLDLRTGFTNLLSDYELELVAADASDENVRRGWTQLEARRRVNNPAGPEHVKIWFDSTGVAHRIELVGMPQERGNPIGVMLELISSDDLKADFFKHETHHDTNRLFDWE